MSTKKSLLVDGNIPAGQPCPFIDQCSLKNEGCPTKEAVKLGMYSCAAARFMDMGVAKRLWPNGPLRG